MREVPLPRAPINEVLATSRVFFGTETLKYRLPAATRAGAMLGIKEYPAPTQDGSRTCKGANSDRERDRKLPITHDLM